MLIPQNCKQPALLLGNGLNIYTNPAVRLLCRLRFAVIAGHSLQAAQSSAPPAAHRRGLGGSRRYGILYILRLKRKVE
jgi:hypothetical protein